MNECKYCGMPCIGDYCGRQCRGNQQKIRPSKYKANNRNNKDRIYAKLADQYGEVCMVEDCGWTECLEVHRLHPGEAGGKYELDNCVLLCPNHHSLITHNIKSKFQNNKLF